MITILKIAVLCLCTAVSFIVSCYSENKKLTCVLLSFFVAAGVTTFFSEEAYLLSWGLAFVVFFVLSGITVFLSQKTAHRKQRKNKPKSL